MEHSQPASSPPDTVYVNGRIWPGLPVHGDTAGEVREHEALAVARGRVVAVGSVPGLLALAGPATQIVDLDHRRVIPGLVDGHMHAVRAGSTWSSELHWSGMPALGHALESIRAAARGSAAGAWIRAIGGWHPCQFDENRPPTQVELDAVAPDHPVYVQGLYDVGILNSRAARTVGLAEWTDLPGDAVERDPATGRATGVIRGLAAFTRCMAAIPHPSHAEQLSSTRAMFADLNAVGLTGVVDPGGFGMSPERYEPLFDLWRAGELTTRMRLYVSAVDAGQELDQLDGWLRHTQSRFGDDLLRILGVGEIIHYGCHDFEGLTPFELGDQSYKELLAITRRVVERGWPMHIHAVLDSTIDRILDAWETVHRETPLDALRFSLAHADTISRRNIRRLKALGAGVVVDDHQVFKGASSERGWGPGSMETVPPLGDLLEADLPLGAGTDATRASSYSPWLSLWWLVEGRSLDGSVQRAPRHRLSREQALHLYTRGSTWFSFEEPDRGHLHPGARADFAVLSDDYFSVAAQVIPSITSELTVVGGRVVHRSAAFAA
ncbi:amidohydrolase [Streptomyces spongiae]|uniref:Amidohydrolase n=1 Tax=Streptomyces spongiae TaxID=565072 RepID=A0A5N8X8X7_9ACTN|nr:amidohydrolase [Streptomyces spongiae]MPY55882.1 amidohydrolase [Streptomyces spongiae]